MTLRRSWLKVAVLTVLVLSLVLPAAAGAQSGILAPTDGSVLKGTVQFKANFPGAPYVRWDLFVLPGGDDNKKIWIASGKDPGEATLSLDTTKFPDGQHAFSLRLVKRDANYDEQIVRFTIANAAPAPAAKPALRDIVDTAVAAGNFKTLVAAVQAAGLVNTLKGAGPFTVFAPTDQAFAKLPAGTVESLLKDPKALSNILLFHVVPGKVMAAQVKDGLTATTAQGSPVTFSVKDGVASINGARIIATDVEASNGVIHVIDTVILPPAAAPAPAPAAKTGILAPTDGATLKGTVQFKANFPGRPYVRWDLFVLPGGDDNKKIWIASGKDPGEATLSLDTTKFPNGQHAFSLRLVKPDANYDEQIVRFTIAN
ncbi:MAG: fasciclin domain-containing protein [Caldilineales bacterium]|nr:fasciclin domain-containing protein [Caldilineales bacterium]MDW8318063.1 fasciclin domain-containing protein [Anaerolineae bacterium]